METKRSPPSPESDRTSQHFFGSGINGNKMLGMKTWTISSSQHFFGSGINGNQTDLKGDFFDAGVTTLLRKWN